jgi:cob(I)alamin adenosyltransferase
VDSSANAKRVRLYTRGGDRGRTLVLGAGRQYKDHPRIMAYGTVDEAGAYIGLAVSLLVPNPVYDDLVQVLFQVQQRLWDVGADLARMPDPAHPYRTPESAAADLEPLIDRYQAELPALTKFILRGGTSAAAALHVACTVVRRAERETVHLSRRETVHAPALRYLNRLSDFLFVAARVANHRGGVADVPYEHSADVFR